jgi:hypothetical protein
MQLADKEQLISEVPLGIAKLSGTLSLTDKRLVLTAPDVEESIPLRAVASVRAAYLRDFAAIVVGAIALLFGLLFAANYKTMETAANAAALSAQKHFFEKGANAAADENPYGRFVNIPSGWVWLLMLPLIGWGGFKVYKGVMGETEIAIGTAAGELRRARDGKRRDMLDFIEEAGKRLP